MTVPATQVRRLDGETLELTGNESDYLAVSMDGYVSSDTTWSAMEVPYYLSGDLAVEGSTGPMLTIEEGAVFLMADDTGVSDRRPPACRRSWTRPSPTAAAGAVGRAA